MLWEVEVRPQGGEIDREALRILAEAVVLGAGSVRTVAASRIYLIESHEPSGAAHLRQLAADLLSDPVVEEMTIHPLSESTTSANALTVMFKPGVTDNVGGTALKALQDCELEVSAVATGRRYCLNGDATAEDLKRLCEKVLANQAIEAVHRGPLKMQTLAVGKTTHAAAAQVVLAGLSDEALKAISNGYQLSLSVAEMRTIQTWFASQHKTPKLIELETIAQTWSEHCSHKTLRGQIRYRDENGERIFKNLLKETIFGATQTLRAMWGKDDWCVSVFQDNAGVVKFDDAFDICFKVETHNHPSAIEPYGGANTGLGGVIRDPLGTGMGAKPICNTDVFCFAPPETRYDQLPPGVLHPKTVMRGVVAGVRDYGNRMGIPTVNGAVFFDPRYLGNPLVYCGNVALLPVGMSTKQVIPGDFIVSVGGRTGRDGIHGATFSSVELTVESETVSGGSVQIGNAITEKMTQDVILQARDLGLYHAITDCGAGGFSSAVGEMGEKTGAEVWLDRAPLKYAGLSATEIWISEAQERMVLAVPPATIKEFQALCQSEGVEASVIGQFRDDGQLVLKFHDEIVGQLPMEFLHEGRPQVVRDAVYQPPIFDGISTSTPQGGAAGASPSRDHTATLLAILAAPNVRSKEAIIRQYDHEVQGGSVVKPLVGVMNDGPSDAAVLRPVLTSNRAIVISNGMNPHYGDLDPYWMAASALDEAVRNAVAVGADPARIAVLDNFCWGNTNRPETLGSLVRAALGCHDTAIAYGTPFISGKDSLMNEFAYDGQTIAIPPSLLISALGQIDDLHTAVTMDLKEPGNLLFLLGETHDELGGSHYNLVHGLTGGNVPRVNLQSAPETFRQLHAAIKSGCVRSCHDLSEGGLAVALAEMAFAGGLGAEVDLTGVIQQFVPNIADADRATVALFSESNTRFLVELAPEHADRFRNHFTSAIPLGAVTAQPQLRVTLGSQGSVVDLSLFRLKSAWQTPLW